MKKIVLIGMCLVLVGCGSKPSPYENTEKPAYKTDATVTYISGTGVEKFCDAGRAIYVYDGYKSGGLAIIENAKECSNIKGN